MKTWTKFYLCMVVPFLPLRLQVFTGEMHRVEECEDKGSWLFLNLNPPLISKPDLMWIFNSDMQLIDVLFAKYSLLNDRIKNNDQLKSCSPLSPISG